MPCYVQHAAAADQRRTADSLPGYDDRFLPAGRPRSADQFQF